MSDAQKLLKPHQILQNLENQALIQRIQGEIAYRTAESMSISGNNPEDKRVEKMHEIKKNNQFLDTQLRVIRNLIDESFGL